MGVSAWGARYIDVNTLSFIAASEVGHVVINDNLWRAFGYKRRPRRGSYFRKFQSKAAWKFESQLVRETISIAIVDLSLAIKGQIHWSDGITDYRPLVLYGAIEFFLKYLPDYLLPSSAFFTRIEAVAEYSSKGDFKSFGHQFARDLSGGDSKILGRLLLGVASFFSSNFDSGKGIIYSIENLYTFLAQYRPVKQLDSNITIEERDQLIKICLRLLGIKG